MHPVAKLIIIIVVIGVVVVLYGRLVGRRDSEVDHAGLSDAIRAKVSREISAGHKVNAMKIYREATGAPLPDAKKAIDGWFVPGRGPGVRDAAASWTEGRLTDEARSRISALVEGGRRDEATSLYAEATGASNTEARAIIRTWDPSQGY